MFWINCLFENGWRLENHWRKIKWFKNFFDTWEAMLRSLKSPFFLHKTRHWKKKAADFLIHEMGSVIRSRDQVWRSFWQHRLDVSHMHTKSRGPPYASLQRAKYHVLQLLRLRSHGNSVATSSLPRMHRKVAAIARFTLEVPPSLRYITSHVLRTTDTRNITKVVHSLLMAAIGPWFASSFLTHASTQKALRNEM